MPRFARLPAPSPLGADARSTARILAEVRDGKLRAAGSQVVADGTTSTAVKDSGFGVGTVLIPVPTTAAGVDLKLHQTGAAKGSVTWGHLAPTGDVTFLWVAIG